MKFDLLYHLISPVTGKLKILLNLGNGLLKTTNDGELSIATPDVDFATSTTLEQIKSDTELYKTEAQIASSSATTAASTATTAASTATTAATGAATSAIQAGSSAATATGAAISAAASAQSASDSANSAADSAAQAVQNIPTFNYPLLKTTNTLSCLYDNLTIGLDASNRLKVISGSSQWTTSGSNIYYNVTGGSVGIGTATPSSSYKLDVNGNINVQGTANTQQFNACDTSAIAALKVRNVNIIGANANLRIFRYGATSNNPGIEFLWNLTTPVSSTDYTYWWDSYIASDGSFRFRCRKPALNLDYFVINTSGRVGIGTATPSSSYKLDVNGNINCTEIYRAGTSLTTTLGTKQDTLTAGTSLLGIGTSITALNATNITSGTLSTTYGGTGVSTSNTINNYLFNNTGATHGDNNDFNAITTAGYKFIQGNINSPSTAYSQYYSWLIGLGINYPVSGTNSYSCQFALPRNTTNPPLSVRYKENNSWTAWTGITASYADNLTSGNKSINGNLSCTGYLTSGNSVWNRSSDGVYRTYYGTNDVSYYCCGGNSADGHIFMNSAYSHVFKIKNNGDTSSTGTETASKYYVNGEDYSFNSNWNGTGAAGWFVSLNQYWYTGHAYLTVAIYAKNVAGSNAYCWFGRVFCSVNTSGTGTPPANNGGIIQIITDYRNPTTSAVNNNFINVKEKWDGNGNNMLWIEINNFNFAGTMHVKIYG